ncbi:hypothetical protein ACE6H2_009450 [Prunus campanulata]
MRQPHLAACGCGVDELALELNLLKLRKPTSAVFNDWGNNKLNKKQVKLATLKVYAYFETGNKVVCMLRKSGMGWDGSRIEFEACSFSFLLVSILLYVRL